MDDNPYNDGYTHEVLHTISILQDMFDSHVISTRTNDEFPDVKEMSEEIAKQLWQLYQLVGTKFKE